jgi:hypothetical protein
VFKRSLPKSSRYADMQNQILETTRQASNTL